MPDEHIPLLTLLTDFGLSNSFVGSMKGAILAVNPKCHIVDITHEIPPHDIFNAAFTLFLCSNDFPTRTIHIVVVDPTVGSSRRAIIVVTDNHYFIGPDNGIFSFIYQYRMVLRVINITAEHYFSKNMSPTFHGRDIFAPVAGWLTKGIDSTKFGDTIEDYVKITIPEEKQISNNLLKGEVCLIDRFGNLITNLRRETIEKISETTGKAAKNIIIAGHEIPFVEGGYDQKDELFALINSAGMVEIAARTKSASNILEIKGRGKEVGVILR